MEIENLTLKQILQLQSLFGGKQNPIQGVENPDILQDYVGKYVIVRTRNEGINCGIVKRLDETGIILSEARRIWYHKPADKGTAWYEGVAVSGLSTDSKLSVSVPEKAIVEDYSITVCSEKATQSLKTHKAYEQS